MTFTSSVTSSPHDTRHRAVLLSVMAVWGLNLPAMKVLITAHDPVVISALRMTLGAGALLLLLHWRNLPRWRFSARQWWGLAACALTIVYVNQVLLMEGMARTTATNASLLMAAGPLFSTLLASLAFREPLTASRAAGLALGFAGVAMVVLHRPSAALGTASIGDLLVLGGVACYAAGSVMVQRLARGLSPESISVVVHLIGAAMLVVHALGWHARETTAALVGMSAWLWTVALFSSVFATAIGNLVWHRSIARQGAGRTSLYVYWVPVFGVGFSVLLLGEPLSLWLLAGGAAVLAGTWLGTRRPAAP